VLPFSAFPTPSLDLRSLSLPSSQNQSLPANWKVYKKSSLFGFFSSKRLITTSLTFPIPRYISSKDWVPFFLYIEVKSNVKVNLGYEKLPELPKRGMASGKGKDKDDFFDPKIILERQDDSPATGLGKSYADAKTIECEVEWLSGSKDEERGRSRSTPNGTNQTEDGIGYSWTDIIKTSSEGQTEDPSSFNGGEELLPRFSQLSFRSRSRTSRPRLSTSDSIDPSNLNLNSKTGGQDGETWYRCALICGKIKTNALIPSFGVPNLSIQYSWRLEWNVKQKKKKNVDNLFGGRKKTNLVEMKLGNWLPSSGITKEEFGNLTTDEVKRRVGKRV